MSQKQEIGRDLACRPKDVRPQARRGFDYFVYPEGPSSTGLETSAAFSDEDSGTTVSSEAFGPTAACTDIEAPATAASDSDNGDGGEESAACSREVPATTQAFSSEDDDVAPPACETKEPENYVETEQHQQLATTTAKTTEYFSWTPSATPNGCMACFETNNEGDRMCRILLCSHVFHAKVSQPRG